MPSPVPVSAPARGELCFGTVDSFLIWRLTGGKVHATDATNASRTLLLDIHSGSFEDELLAIFEVPRAMLPEVKDCATLYGTTAPELFGGAIPIRGVAGDQQAATIGQACFAPGMMKSTYGTGCFALLNTGRQSVISRNRLLTTIAYQLGGERTYALEGSIFVAGAAVQWLRDGLGIIPDAGATAKLAAAADPDQAVYLVPAFVGLGAPWWDAEARGILTGLTRGTGRAELARAALEAVCYQTRDLLEAMRGDWQGGTAAGTVLRVDGGMVASDWTMQFLADIIDAPVDRPRILETTALGAAYLAGLDAGLYPAPAEFAKSWQLDRRFTPQMDEATRARKFAGWRDAVAQDAVTGRDKWRLYPIIWCCIRQPFLWQGTCCPTRHPRPLSARLRFFVVIAGGPMRTVGAPMPSVSALVSSIGWHAGTPLLAHKQIKCSTVLRHTLLRLYSKKASQSRIGLNDSKSRLSLSSGTALVGRRRTLRLHHAQPVYGQCA